MSNQPLSNHREPKKSTLVGVKMNIVKTSGYNNKILFSNINNMEVSSNRNLNKAEVSYQKSTQSQSPAIPPEAHTTPEMHSMKSSDNSIEDVVTMLSIECYRVFAKKIKPLPPEYRLSDFYYPSEVHQIGQLLPVTVGTALAIYTLYKYLN